jgi:hypothetical protein
MAMNPIGKILAIPLLAFAAGALVLPALAQRDRGSGSGGMMGGGSGSGGMMGGGTGSGGMMAMMGQGMPGGGMPMMQGMGGGGGRPNEQWRQREPSPERE